MCLIKHILTLTAVCLFSANLLFAQSGDDDKDGIPNAEDVCPLAAGPEENKGCPQEKKSSVETEAELVRKNFLLILADIKNDFRNIQSGEIDWDPGTRQGSCRSSVWLFPATANQSYPSLQFATYLGKPMNAYNENSTHYIDTIVNMLHPVFKQKKFTEVQLTGALPDAAGRSFRSAEGVIQLVYNPERKETYINIGKFPVYYAAAVKPLLISSVSLADLIKKANEQAKKKTNRAFESLATARPAGFYFSLPGTHVYAASQVKGAYLTAVNKAKDEILIQAEKERPETENMVYKDPAAGLQPLGPGLKVLFKDENSITATYDQLSISVAPVEGIYYNTALMIFIRPLPKKEKKTIVKETPKKPDAKPITPPVSSFCSDLQKVLKESENGYVNVRYNKKESEDMEGTFTYDARLPMLGFDKLQVTEEAPFKVTATSRTYYDCYYYVLFKDDTKARAFFKQMAEEGSACVKKKGEQRKIDKTEYYVISFEQNGMEMEIEMGITKLDKGTEVYMMISNFGKK